MYREGGGAGLTTLAAWQAHQPIPKLSMREKSVERSIAKKNLHRNFKSGHITPNEHYLGRAGLRGRKRWCCLALFVLIYLFALAHLTVSSTAAKRPVVYGLYGVCVCLCDEVSSWMGKHVHVKMPGNPAINLYSWRVSFLEFCGSTFMAPHTWSSKMMAPLLGQKEPVCPQFVSPPPAPYAPTQTKPSPFLDSKKTRLVWATLKNI